MFVLEFVSVGAPVAVPPRVPVAATEAVTSPNIVDQHPLIVVRASFKVVEGHTISCFALESVRYQQRKLASCFFMHQIYIETNFKTQFENYVAFVLSPNDFPEAMSDRNIRNINHQLGVVSKQSLN